MTEKDLKKLGRPELLELLITSLKENESLKKQIKEKDKQLKSKEILINKSGTLAEAALRLNDVFESADKAAAQYLENIQNSEAIAQRIIDDAKEEAKFITSMAKKESDAMLKDAKDMALAMNADYLRKSKTSSK